MSRPTYWGLVFSGMVFSFLQFELKALSAVRDKPGAEQRSLLRGEVELLVTNRSVCPAAQPTASRLCALEASEVVLTPFAKVTVAQEASCDELNAPFSEASCATTLRFFMILDIQVSKDTKHT
jgi:hypothetical protein